MWFCLASNISLLAVIHLVDRSRLKTSVITLLHGNENTSREEILKQCLLKNFQTSFEN